MGGLEAFLEILGLVFAGYTLRKVGIFSEGTSSHLNAYVVYLAMPALVFTAMLRVPIQGLLQHLKLVVISMSLSAMCTLIGFAVARKMARDRRDAMAVALTSGLGNTGFLGYPVCLSTFGEPGLEAAVFYDFGTTLSVIVAYLMLSSRRENPLKMSLRFPPAHAAVAGICWGALGLHLPDTIRSTLQLLGRSVVPVIMVSLGASLRWDLPRSVISVIPTVWIVKLCASPIVAAIIAPSGLDGEVAVLEAAMPPALMNLVLAELLGLRPHVTAALVFSTTVISLATVPTVIYLVSGGGGA
ncbi:AEC family transporter [Methanopyrus kandleri]